MLGRIAHNFSGCRRGRPAGPGSAFLENGGRKGKKSGQRRLRRPLQSVSYLVDAELPTYPPPEVPLTDRRPTPAHTRVHAAVAASRLRKGEKGNPPGIFDHNSGDKQARLVGVKVNGKAYQRPIPGRYKSIEEAAAAQAVAYQKFATGGVEAVWPTTPMTDRNQRGTVRHAFIAN